ncbi:universal stress protein [Tamlana sp. 2_MG-2023]|uniref:universal stress protein n=1 Tax=unclassified Tamlana TaxID=2614803 RepID=UPI0026E12897|nr:MULTISPECIES: universal stress protein [unclassified Tamlana]MDO6758689.1 universal stress protein [Tamlana sp. 2_MG-2023]MDO6789388.1 universal stress protein [Tamlana sp. 1_MG-2023]
MEKIIVPVDFSEHSEYALQTAAKLAKRYQAELLVLHMLEMPEMVLTSTGKKQNEKAGFLLRLTEQKFEKLLDKDFLFGLKVTPIIKHFKMFSEVNDVAIENGADLIVMGTQGASGFKEMFMGSNTERVIRYAEIPVLAVKKEVVDVSFEVITFACDFSEECIPAYLKALVLFESMNSKMYLVYVNLPNDKFKSSVEIEKRVADFFIKACGNLRRMKDVHYVSHYSVEEGVLNFSNKIGADLIALPTHGKKGLAHFFEGSVGEDVANHATLPVMTFKI